MNDKYVSTPGEALAYITDCKLATVCHMAMLKSRSKYEYARQISIAQKAIDWLRQFDIDGSTTRAAGIIKHYDGSVEAWAKTFEPNAEKIRKTP